MQHSYSFNVSETLIQEGGMTDEDRLVQTVRAEIYDQTPLFAVHGGSFGSLTQLAIQNVSDANLQTMVRISKNNLLDLGAEETAALDPAAELAKLVKQRSSDVVTFPLAVAVVLALVTQFLSGYNTAVLNSVSLVVFPGHSTTAWAVAVGAFAIGGPMGSMVAGRLADRLGRRAAMLLCTYVFLSGGLVLSLAPTIEVLSLGRVALGFASGYSSVLVPIYLGELAPPSLRGLFGTCTQMALVCGILAASLLAFPLANYNVDGAVQGWRWMMAVTPLCCGLQLCLAPMLHESPRWLLQRNPHSAQAALSLKQLYGLATDKEVDLEISHILNAADRAGPSSKASALATATGAATSSLQASSGRYQALGQQQQQQPPPPPSMVVQACGSLTTTDSPAASLDGSVSSDRGAEGGGGASAAAPAAGGGAAASAGSMGEGTMPLKGGYAGTGEAKAPLPLLSSLSQDGGSGPGGSAAAPEINSMAALLSDTAVRPLVLVAVVLHVSQQMGGINAVFYYSTDFFRGVIDNPLVGSTLCAFVNVLATMLATVLMDRVPRRTLMTVSVAGMLGSTVLVVLALLHQVPNFIALVAVMAFVSFFEVGLGPIPWLIVAEMFDSKYVASAQSLACQINWFCNFMVGVGFPFVQQSLGPWSFVPFGCVLVCCLLFVTQRMPETRGATLGDIKYQVKVMWGMFDDLLRDPPQRFATMRYGGVGSDAAPRVDSAGGGDSSGSLSVYKQRLAMRHGGGGSSSGGLHTRSRASSDVEGAITF